LQQQESLLQDGLITRQQYEQTRQAIFAAQNEIGLAHNALQNLSLQNISNNGTYEERIRQSNANLLQAGNRLEDLRVQYDIASKLVSPHDGIVVEKMVSPGDIVTANQPVLSIESDLRHYQAIIYMPLASQAKRIEPGMDVQIALSTAEKERYGYMLGKVKAISKYPSTEQGMMAAIHNQAIVREMSKSGPPFSIYVDLVPDKTSRSGYQWSSKAGAQVDFWSGTFCQGSFTIEKQKPISLIIPLLKNMAGF
jgi:HlyD family secretion protein